MKLNSKGEIVYIRYGSPRGYKCLHCAKTLTQPPKEAIYGGEWDWFKDGADRVRCRQCGNLAERI